MVSVYIRFFLILLTLSGVPSFLVAQNVKDSLSLHSSSARRTFNRSRQGVLESWSTFDSAKQITQQYKTVIEIDSDFLKLADPLGTKNYNSHSRLVEKSEASGKSKITSLNDTLDLDSGSNQHNLKSFGIKPHEFRLIRVTGYLETAPNHFNKLKRGLEMNEWRSIDIPYQNVADLNIDTSLQTLSKAVEDIVPDIELLKKQHFSSETEELSKVFTLRADSVETIKKELMAQSESAIAMAEGVAENTKEITAIEEAKSKSIEQGDEIKRMMDALNDRKKVEQRLVDQAKEVADDIAAQHQDQIQKTMKDLAKYRRKFSSVPDMRKIKEIKLHRADKIPLRNRIVSGFTLQVIKSTETWLEFDPQVYFKLSTIWSIGAGHMYRFSMNTDKVTFKNFGSLYGGKIFFQNASFKDFFIRGEGQYLRWHPWETITKDPDFTETAFVAALGIGKTQSISKRIRSNVQTLYHYTWGASDPYKPRIMIRFGIDFLLTKRIIQPWQKKLTEMKNKERRHRLDRAAIVLYN